MYDKEKPVTPVCMQLSIKSIFQLSQDHTDLNHENNKGLIISETIQAMPIRFAVKIVQLKVYMITDLHSRSQ